VSWQGATRSIRANPRRPAGDRETRARPVSLDRFAKMNARVEARADGSCVRVVVTSRTMSGNRQASASTWARHHRRRQRCHQ
jgi:hypothetical protein